MQNLLKRIQSLLLRSMFPTLSVLQGRVKNLEKKAAKNEDRLNALIDLVARAQLQSLDTSGMTAQERAWFGAHGFRYIVHHLSEDWETTRVPFWANILSMLPDVRSVCEYGANIGANLKAIRQLKPDLRISGIEVNPVACRLLRDDGFDVSNGSIAELTVDGLYDIVFSRGVIIHIKPSDVGQVLRNMASQSNRYVMIYEHYSEHPRSIPVYDKAVAKTMGESSEGYQFWADYSGRFAELFPRWEVIASGVNLDIGKKPSDGDLHWTIFSKPK